MTILSRNPRSVTSKDGLVSIQREDKPIDVVCGKQHIKVPAAVGNSTVIEYTIHESIHLDIYNVNKLSSMRAGILHALAFVHFNVSDYESIIDVLSEPTLTELIRKTIEKPFNAICGIFSKLFSFYNYIYYILIAAIVLLALIVVFKLYRMIF